jgi:hypothetical protein
MPQAVVDVLKPSDPEQETERGLIPLRPRDFGLDLALEVGVVPKPRQIVEVRHELGLPQLRALHDHGLREKVGLVEEIVECRGAQVDLPPLRLGKPRLVHEETLPVVFHFPRLEVETKESKDAVALPVVIRQTTVQLRDGRRRRPFELLMPQHRHLLENTEAARGPFGGPALQMLW